MRFAVALPLLLLSACGTAQSQPLAAGTKLDRLIVDKSDRC
jgi:hypothetical protein